MDNDRGIERYTQSDRTNHWLVVILFFMAALSGLAFFHPSLFWLTGLFGGGPWARILHPFFGVVMFVLFLGMMFRFWGHNRMTDADKGWLKRWRDVLANREENLPEAGRYNAGQKVLFWLLVISMMVLLVTGVIFWRPYFAGNFPIDLIRLATLLHAVAAVVLIIAIIGHIYMAIWVKGSFNAMIIGTVARSWAKKHHPAWFKEVTHGK